jgi:hypothetical protein
VLKCVPVPEPINGKPLQTKQRVETLLQRLCLVREVHREWEHFVDWLKSLKLSDVRPDDIMRYKFHLIEERGLALVVYLCFLFIGTTIVFLPGNTPGTSAYRGDYSLGILITFMCFAMFVGMITGAGATPSRLTYMKGLRSARKEEKGRVAWFDDHASNAPRLISYCVVTLAAYAVFYSFVPIEQYLRQAAVLLVAVFYALSFLAALEAFRLGKHHEKKNFFILIVAVPWFFIPLIGFVFPLVDTLASFVPYLLIACPFLGVGLMSGVMNDDMLLGQESERALAITATIVNVLLAAILLVLAQLQRHRLGELE